MIFPNRIESDAEFLVHSQTIHLKKINKRKFLKDIETQNISEICKPYSIIMHELTHWFDATSTLWGQMYLRDLYDVYFHVIHHSEGVASDRESGEIEEEWWRLVKLDCEDSRILFPAYYKEHYTKNNKFDYKTADITYSSGLEFGIDGRINVDKPIFFIRVIDKAKNSISRVPLTIGSILESSAVCAELLSRIATIAKISLPYEQKIQQNNLLDELDHLLSSCDLFDYTVARHMVMKENKVSDIIDSYIISAMFSFVSLNLPDELFDKIVPPALLGFIPKERIERFKKNKDRTFVFACLCSGCGLFSGDIKHLHSFLNLGLNNIGLPTFDDILDKSYNAMLKIRDSVYYRCQTDKTCSYILSVGRSNFLKRRQQLFPSNIMNIINEDTVLPDLIDENQETFRFRTKHLNEKYFNIEKMYCHDIDLNALIVRFRSACKI